MDAMLTLSRMVDGDSSASRFRPLLPLVVLTSNGFVRLKQVRQSATLNF